MQANLVTCDHCIVYLTLQDRLLEGHKDVTAASAKQRADTLFVLRSQINDWQKVFKGSVECCQ